MNPKKRRIIAIHVEDGLFKRVSSNMPADEDATVVVVDNGVTRPAVFVTPADEREDLVALVTEAVNKLRCAGMGTLCGLVGERFIALERKNFGSDWRGIEREMHDLMEECRRNMDAAVHCDPYDTDVEPTPSNGGGTPGQPRLIARR